MSHISNFTKVFFEQGFTICPANSLSSLSELRDVIFDEARILLGSNAGDCERFFNEFHENKLDEMQLNDFRVELIKNFNGRVDGGRLVWEAFRDLLQDLVGPDVAVQKSVNLVIHRPGDTDQPPIHRDAPPNSPFEVVAWIPLVDCYDTKSMYLLDRQNTPHALAIMDNPAGNNGQDLLNYVAQNGRHRNVSYGEGLFFWTPLLHAIPVNRENQTRWSINLRFKNVFSPYGKKGIPDYFRVLNLSPLTRLAIDWEKARCMEKE